MNQLAPKATPERARVHNTRLVLRTIYDSDGISRAEVSRATQLTRPTVSDLVASLIEQGLVEEVGYAPSTGGKRPILLRVGDDARQLIGIDLARGDFRGAVISLRGDIRYRIDLPLRGRDCDAALALIYELVDALAEAASSPLLGIGIGAPGLVDAASGVMHRSVNLNWRDVPLRSLLQERYGLPVYVANDCQVAALAEYAFGSGGDNTKDLVVINVGWGVGAGIVLNGQVLHGDPFGAGEIGHVAVMAGGERCSCGNYGCLETVASRGAIVRRVQAIARDTPGPMLQQYAASPERITFDTVCQVFEAGDEAVQQVVREVGQSLGVAGANLVGVLGACRILVGGCVARFGPFLIDTMREEMRRRCLPSLAGGVEIGAVSLGSDTVLLGASALLLPSELGLLGATQRSRGLRREGGDGLGDPVFST